MVKKINLTQGQVAIVDDEDFEYLNQWKWHVSMSSSSNDYYAKRTQHLGMFNGEKKQKSIQMHRLIMNAPKGKVVDHINHDTLDNRKENLRIVSTRQNLQNKKRKMSSKYPGVSWSKSVKKWRADININGKLEHLGTFHDEKTAAKAYEMAQRLFCHENLVCKQFKDASYTICEKFSPIWKIRYTSKYRGVSWERSSRKWKASLVIKGKQKTLGRFINEKEAAKAYERACRELIGEELVCKEKGMV